MPASKPLLAPPFPPSSVSRRHLVGTFLAFDKHLNLVLSDTAEHRTLTTASSTTSKSTRVERRTLGLVILRGENVVSITVEGPPPPKATARVTPGGPGVAVGKGRGMPVGGAGAAAPMGLGAGVFGVGGGMGRGR